MNYIKLGEIATITNGKRNAQDAVENGQYPLYDRSVIIKKSDKYLFDKEALIVAGEGKTFLPRYYKGKFDLHQRCYAIFDIDPNYDIMYIYYYLKWNQDYFQQVYTGSTVPSLRLGNFTDMPIKKADLIYQQNASKNLALLEKTILVKQNQLLSLDELIKSRFIEMFDTIDMSEERDEWEPLENLCKIYTGTTPSSTDDSNWSGDILWITPAEMNADSFYIYDTVRKITEKGRKSKSLDIMPVNTVLLSTRAPIGKVGIVGTPMACNQGFKNFECGDRLNPVFLYVLLKNNTEYLNSLGSGTTFLEVSKSKIAKTKVPVPNIEKQNQFENFVKQIDKSKFIVQQQIKDLQELLDKKMDEYFGD